MLDTAIKVALEAGKLANTYFNTQLKVTYKKNAKYSPVSIADKKTELLARKIISEKFPDHGFIGEEYGRTKPKARFRWTIDPIDGTRDFVRGNPFWCTLIAVLEKNMPIIGVCYYPNNNELFYAEKGQGAFLNGKKIELSKVSKLKKSYINVTSSYHFLTHNKLNQHAKLTEAAGAARYFSTVSYAMLWKSKSEGYIAGRGSIWDFAAPAIITEEAGGKYSDFAGDYSLESDNAVFTNGKIHKEVLKILNSKS